MLTSKLRDLEQQKELLVAEETILMRKALQSDDPHAFIKAQTYYQQIQEKNDQVKSFFVDPTTSLNNYGYLSTPQKINDFTLRRMAQGSPVIKAIIETRVEQIADFLEPQSDKYSHGFVIRKKRKYYSGDDEEEVTKEDQDKIQLLTEFMLRGCADSSIEEMCDDLQTWGRKTVKDTLTIDKIASEIVYNNAGTLPVGFIPVDASTIYFADNKYDANGNFKPKSSDSKDPKYVQVLNGEIRSEYFNEEMMFAVRNPQTNMYTNGYGESELEVLIGTVTAMLQGDAYNSNIFKVGSTPSGIFRVQGNINESRLREFKTQWANSMSGYSNNGRMAFLEADKMEFVDLSKSNRDMEYSKFQEYLIKLACAVYKISPEEIGFTVQGSNSQSMFQDSGEKRLEYSKSKGLKPLLKFLQRQINNKLISKIAPDFEFVFVGLDAESEEKELDMAIKKASSFKSFKEIRRERGLQDEIDEDDFVMNQYWIQHKQMMMMGNAESNRFIDEESEEKDPVLKGWQSDENPMAKEFMNFVEKDLIEK